MKKYAYRVASTSTLKVSPSSFLKFINELGADGYKVLSANPIVVKKQKLSANDSPCLCTDEGYLLFMKEYED